MILIQVSPSINKKYSKEYRITDSIVGADTQIKNTIKERIDLIIEKFISQQKLRLRKKTGRQ